jgi:hypothetical protein
VPLHVKQTAEQALHEAYVWEIILRNLPSSQGTQVLDCEIYLWLATHFVQKVAEPKQAEQGDVQLNAHAPIFLWSSAEL